MNGAHDKTLSPEILALLDKIAEGGYPISFEKNCVTLSNSRYLIGRIFGIIFAAGLMAWFSYECHGNFGSVMHYILLGFCCLLIIVLCMQTSTELDSIKGNIIYRYHWFGKIDFQYTSHIGRFDCLEVQVIDAGDDPKKQYYLWINSVNGKRKLISFPSLSEANDECEVVACLMVILGIKRLHAPSAFSRGVSKFVTLELVSKL